MAAAVQHTELMFEVASDQHDDGQQLVDPLSFPAVIVEQMPHAHLLSYSGLACEQPITDAHLGATIEQSAGEDITLSVEAYQSGDEDNVETAEAAEALLNMDSPYCLSLDEKQLSEAMTSPVTQVSVLAEGLVGALDQQQWFQIHRRLTPDPSSQPPKAKRGRRAKRPRAVSPMPDITVKKNKDGKGNTLYLWEFLMALLQDRNACPRYIKWTNREKGIFKLVDSKAVSQLWGKHKNKPDMNYETMGRALRYYYQRGILNKVEGQRLVYQFAELPKNIVYIGDDDGGDDDDDAEDGPENGYVHHQPSKPQTAKASPAARHAAAPGSRTQQGRRTRAALNGGAPQGGGGDPAPTTTVTPAQTQRPLSLIQQQHLPIVSAEMLRTLQKVQAIQPGRHGSVFRTAQLLESLREKQPHLLSQEEEEEEVKAEEEQQGGAATQIVTLQLVPMTTSGEVADGSGSLGSQQFFMQTFTDSPQQVTLLMESVAMDAQSVGPQTTESDQSAVSYTPQAGGVGAQVVTLVGGGQQLVTQPHGTVIHSVVTAAEPKELSGSSQATEDPVGPEDSEQGLDGDLESQAQAKQQPLSMVLLNDSWVGFTASQETAEC